MIKINENKLLLLKLAFLCLVILIFLLIFITIFKYQQVKDFFDVPTNHERPFVNVYGVKDDEETQLRIILLSHPFTRDSSWEQYQEYINDNFLVLGISSYNEFPGITTNKIDVLHNPKEKAWSYDYMKVVKGWLHCFRKPDTFIDPNIPKALISESDFCNSSVYKPDSSIEKIYDFIYVCPKDSDTIPEKKKDCYGWGATNKNWKLGKKCIEKLCGKYKLKGLLVGRDGCKLSSKCDGLITTTNFLSQDELIKSYNQSKFILMSNQTDASPRVLTEALCCDIPVLVNFKILGGWKYINSKTGAFFKNQNDLKDGLEHILKNRSELSPRQYYLDNYGKENTGKRLKKFIQTYFNNKINVDEYDYLKL